MLAVVFPGQGSQAVGMAIDFARGFPEARAALDEAEAGFGGGLLERIERGPDEELSRTEITQPAVLAASIAIWRVVEKRLAVQPAVFAGHSLGEYSAVVAAGGLPLGDAVRLVRRRGALMQEAVPEGEGSMAAVLGSDPETIARVCAETPGLVAPANFNSPAQTVIAGRRSSVSAAGEALLKAGAKRVVPLQVSAPFHCALMAPAMEKLAPELGAAPFRELRVPVISNVDAKPYTRAHDARARLREQVCAPVRWVDCVQAAIGAGAKLELEVGPGKVLTGLAAKIDRALARASVENVAELEPALARAAEAAK
ncbi:MAG TPA: ACP S-malonyltransferase [Myxococcota bacterium]|nr:ACP S-malonyltransferase [Myxococcota bacterium]